MNAGSARLVTGSQVAIVGGGPAGSFFALHLLNHARRRNLDLRITLYEEKSFLESGKAGCNMCAGILSSSLVRNLSCLGLELPDSVVLSRISAYCLHTPFGTIETPQPDPRATILSVYRGSGPRGALFERGVSFDGFLLQKAVEQGVELAQGTVSSIAFAAPGERPRVVFRGAEREFDLVVLACGVNSRLLQHMPPPYKPPPTQRMAQDELQLGAEGVASALENKVHVFLLPNTGLVFGTLIPKGEYINVSLLSRGPAPMTVQEFLAHPIVRDVLPAGHKRSCGCVPLVPLGPASHPFGERFVAVGDAAVSRLYKDGIGTAFQTARQAALTAVEHGVAEDSFRRHYQPTFQELSDDNRYGRMLFAMHHYTSKSRHFFDIRARMLSAEQNKPYAQRCLDQITWGMFTGAYSYRSILQRTLWPSMWSEMLQAVFMPPKVRAGGPASDLDAPHEKRVLVLGGGFAGVYTTLHLERALGRRPDISISLVSDENFFLFTPLLHEVATGGIETRHIALPIRRLRGKRLFSFVQAEVLSVDLASRTVHTSRGDMQYDVLVLALGSVTDRRALPGPDSRVFTLKTLRDGIVLRNHVIRMFEAASAMEGDPAPLVTFVVVGGGTIGVQLVAELRDFIYGSLLKEYTKISPESVRVILTQSDERILPEIDPELSSIARRVLEKQGVEVLTGTQVTRVRPNCVELNCGRVISTHTVVWAPGIVASPVVAALPVEKDAIHRVIVNEYLEVPSYPGVYALGDNAHFDDERMGQPLPPTAHIAVRQPKVVAANIVAELEGRPKQPYRYRHMGQIIALGPRSAVAEIYGFRTHGFLTRLVRMVAYSAVMMGRYNRIRVFTDWLLGLFFGRDSTLLRVRW
ncbi:MAG: FAD-dependent oxidoreductase [Bacteroidetes bacterium]|nr:FAD-dependent oxidoreductase [Bacteroidota bacterium]MCL5026265.1 FAD-dependent oxidoreductase [Chloroflexota bacterium]